MQRGILESAASPAASGENSARDQPGRAPAKPSCCWVPGRGRPPCQTVNGRSHRRRADPFRRADRRGVVDQPRRRYASRMPACFRTGRWRGISDSCATCGWPPGGYRASRGGRRWLPPAEFRERYRANSGARSRSASPGHWPPTSAAAVRFRGARPDHRQVQHLFWTCAAPSARRHCS